MYSKKFIEKLKNINEINLEFFKLKELNTYLENIKIEGELIAKNEESHIKYFFPLIRALKCISHLSINKLRIKKLENIILNVYFY